MRQRPPQISWSNPIREGGEFSLNSLFSPKIVTFKLFHGLKGGTFEILYLKLTLTKARTLKT